MTIENCSGGIKLGKGARIKKAKKEGTDGNQQVGGKP